jgi:hypothetical protein
VDSYSAGYSFGSSLGFLLVSALVFGGITAAVCYFIAQSKNLNTQTWAIIGGVAGALFGCCGLVVMLVIVSLQSTKQQYPMYPGQQYGQPPYPGYPPVPGQPQYPGYPPAPGQYPGYPPAPGQYPGYPPIPGQTPPPPPPTDPNQPQWPDSGTPPTQQ